MFMSSLIVSIIVTPVTCIKCDAAHLRNISSIHVNLALPSPNRELFRELDKQTEVFVINLYH